MNDIVQIHLPKAGAPALKNPKSRLERSQPSPVTALTMSRRNGHQEPSKTGGHIEGTTQHHMGMGKQVVINNIIHLHHVTVIAVATPAQHSLPNLLNHTGL